MNLKRNTFYFIVLAILTLLLNLLSKTILNTDDLIMSSLAEKLTNEQLEETIGFKDKWEWMVYILTPVFLLLKVSVISAIIHAGCFLFDKNIKYKELFNVVVKAEFIFILVIVFKTVWFYVFQQDYTVEDLQYFYPMSILNIVGYDNLQPWFIYPLQVVNILEILYWGILAYLLGKALNENMDKGITIVASSYGVSLIIWVAAVMFFVLNIN